jgi:hypothetical protein
MKRSDKSGARLSVARPETNGAAQVRLGGIVLWGPNDDIIAEEVSRLTDAIVQCARLHLSITRPVLRKLVCEMLSENVEERVFSALLGSTLRLGLIDALFCGSENDKAYRVFVHASQIERFERALRSTQTQIDRLGRLTVGEVEEAVFGSREYNTWSSSLHILARLSYLGICTFESKNEVRKVDLGGR